jgi:hypothetical protein
MRKFDWRTGATPWRNNCSALRGFRMRATLTSGVLRAQDRRRIGVSRGDEKTFAVLRLSIWDGIRYAQNQQFAHAT